MIERLQNLGGLLVQTETSVTCMSRFISRFEAVLTGFKQRKSRIKLLMLFWVTAIYKKFYLTFKYAQFLFSFNWTHRRYQEEMHGCLHQSVMVYLVFWFNGFLQTYVSTIPFR